MRAISTDVRFIEKDGTERPATAEETAEHLRKISDPRPLMDEPITFTVAPDAFECDHCHTKADGLRLDHPKVFAAYQPPPGWWVFYAEGGDPTFLCSEACARVFSGEAPGA